MYLYFCTRILSLTIMSVLFTLLLLLVLNVLFSLIFLSLLLPKINLQINTHEMCVTND